MLGRAAEFLPAVLMNKVHVIVFSPTRVETGARQLLRKFSHRKPVTCDGSALLKDQPLHDDCPGGAVRMPELNRRRSPDAPDAPGMFPPSVAGE
jgi:hypothetical protein